MPFGTPFLPDPTTASSSVYDGTPAPSPSDAGTLSCGSWNSQNLPNNGFNFPVQVIQGVPANVRVQLSGAGIVSLGPNQYRAMLSLSGTNTIQLTPNAADAHQQATSAVLPASFTWGYVSRNVKIATVSDSGLVTAVGRGECEITVRSFRQVNASFSTSTPSGTESVDASLLVTVTA